MHLLTLRPKLGADCLVTSRVPRGGLLRVTIVFPERRTSATATPNSALGNHQPRVWSRSFSSIWRMSRPFIASPSSSEASRTIFGSL